MTDRVPRLWWTVSEISQAADCHRQTVLHAIWRGSLPAHMFGRTYAIPSAEALAFIKHWRSGGGV
jgi:excisionase family DNA binding protein